VTAPDEYENGDVNVVTDDYEDGDVNLVEDEYEDGDVNTAEDVNVAGSAAEATAESDSNSGNRTGGGMPGAVLGYLARSLAADTSAVVVDVEERRGSIRLRLHVAHEDMGRVIGRRGRTAQAIRTLVGVAGARDGVQTSVDIVDD
jgi:predicted RNA-binding protein YlqC (UPF0109 family)